MLNDVKDLVALRRRLIGGAALTVIIASCNCIIDVEDAIGGGIVSSGGNSPVTSTTSGMSGGGGGGKSVGEFTLVVVTLFRSYRHNELNWNQVNLFKETVKVQKKNGMIPEPVLQLDSRADTTRECGAVPRPLDF